MLRYMKDDNELRVIILKLTEVIIIRRIFI